MRMEKLTTTLQSTLGEAQSLALAAKHAELKPQHLMQAWLNDPRAGMASLLARAGVDLATFAESIKEQLNAAARLSNADGQISASQGFARAVNRAETLTAEHGDQFVSSE